MGRENKKSGSSGRSSDPSAPAGAAPEETSTLKKLVGGAVKGANGIIDTVHNHRDDPAAPLSYAESLLPKPVRILTQLDTDSVVEGGATLAFNAAGQMWDKAVDFVSKHGKKDPNGVAAESRVAMGGNDKLPNKSAGKGKSSLTT